jgi:ribosomal protein S18 acetylase RimI-like enzyme
MPNIIVRSAQERDFEFACNLYRKAGCAHAQAEPDIFVEEDTLNEERFSCEIGEQIVLVAEADGRSMGVCTCTVLTTQRFPGLRSRKLCRINNIAVDAACRHQGVGTALYEAAMAKAREYGCDAVQLNVWAFNENAVAFYRGLGMRCVSHRFEQVV